MMETPRLTDGMAGGVDGIPLGSPERMPGFRHEPGQLRGGNSAPRGGVGGAGSSGSAPQVLGCDGHQRVQQTPLPLCPKDDV